MSGEHWIQLLSEESLRRVDAHGIGTLARDLQQASTFGESEDTDERIEEIRREQLAHLKTSRSQNRLASIAVVSTLADLSRQGWRFRLQAGRLEAQSAVDTGRASRRPQLLAQRAEQLRTQSVRSFVKRMEQTRRFAARRVSIFSLMRDGRGLADVLSRAVSRGSPISEALRPYVQVVESGATCELTGLDLVDIWRYFRHTWANPYQSVPGRTMLMLVRDAAAPFHPIVGIAALSSAALRLKARDEFLGWEPERVLHEMSSHPTRATNAWLRDTIEERLSEIYRIDLIKDGLISSVEIRRPTREVIDRLKVESHDRRSQHHANAESSDYKIASFKKGEAEIHWEKQSRTPLFRGKRALALAELLSIRMVVNKYITQDDDTEGLKHLLTQADGRNAISQVARLAKSVRVGTAIADLTVCGAVPPYNSLLAGKLVAMLAVSPEVVSGYQRRYSNTPSVIASSMAGRTMIRSSNLVFVGTTSLYGERPCQYDRICIPGELLGGDSTHSIRYRFLAETEGWGTFQFGEGTTRAIMNYVKAQANGQRVNFIFGEGANPKLRALREGLAALGFDVEILLRHGQKRAMYAVSLVSNLTEYLLGQTGKPRYLFDLRQVKKSTESIATWWSERWLRPRLGREGILDRVREDTLIHPIEHRAREKLPPNDYRQGTLFSSR
jgi:hypothetical protein